MKKILALIWILLLCLGLLIFSIADSASDSHAQTPQDPQTKETAPGPATPDTATPDVPAEALPVSGESTPDTPQPTTEPEPVEKIRIHFLNGQPVLQLIYDQLAEEFFAQTGIRVETTSSEANLEGAQPVLFSVNDATELDKWSCLDLSDTVACANLAGGGFTLTQAEQVLGIASEAEPFGLIFNTALLARVGHTGSDIDSFSDLKAVAEYITAHQEDLGFGAFAVPDEAGQFAALLSAVPQDIRALWDLYGSNLSTGDVYSGEAVFCLGTVSDMKRMSAGGELQLQMLPLYTGTEGEEGQGLYCFGKHYWCVRSDATQEEIDAALAFLNFLVSPRTDGTVPVDDLGILAPYRQAVYVQNAMDQRFRSDIAQGKTVNVCGAEEAAPAGYAQALLTYAADPTEENWTAAEQLK